MENKTENDKIGIQKYNNCLMNELTKDLYFSENDISNGESSDIAEIGLRFNFLRHVKSIKPKIQIKK